MEQNNLPPQGNPQDPTTQSSNSHTQERNWAVGCHLSGLAMFLLPFGNIIGPLVVWLMKKDQMPLVAKEGKKALNFQISMAIYGMAAIMLCFLFVGFLILPAVVILNVIFTVMAAVKTSNGEDYQYPLAIQLIK